MAQIKEILETERNNRDKIYLYREGLFYKAYEHSAYLWVHNVCEYEVRCRYVKIVNQNVISIGFPQNALKSKVIGLKTEEFPQGVIIHAGEDIPDCDFDKWKSELVNKAQNVDKTLECQEPSICYGRENKYGDVIDELRRFPIETSSPIDCMMLVSRLKKML